MASFIQPGFPSRHQGLARVESAYAALKAVRQVFDSTGGLSVMLLAAMASTLVVVADQLIDTWADGHLLVAWVALWLIGFAALAMFSAPARKLAITLVSSFGAWSERLARARADERLWALAKADPRVMADLDAARLRSEYR